MLTPSEKLIARKVGLPPPLPTKPLSCCSLASILLH